MTGTLSQSEQKKLSLFAEQFQKAYGVALDVRIQDTAFPPVRIAPGHGNTTLFIGICPAEEQVVVAAPPLVRGILGDEYIEELEQAHFLPYFARGNWPEGLAHALNTITMKLDAALLRQTGASSGKGQPDSRGKGQPDSR